jgi:hypothetical protein
MIDEALRARFALSARSTIRNYLPNEFLSTAETK